MEPKREVTSVDLAALVGELQDVTGATVDKAYRYDEDLLRLKLRSYDRGRIEILIEVGSTKRIHIADPARIPEAPERPPDFARMLRNRIAGGTLTEVTQFEFDRILTLGFERGESRTELVIELFGDGNVAVLDEFGDVIDSLRTVRLRSRTVAPGARYDYPQARINPLEISREAFRTYMHESDTDIVRTLATQLNLGGRYAEEVCSRAEVEKTRSIAEAETEEFDRLYDALTTISSTITERRFDPRLYLQNGTVVDVTPIPLQIHESFDFERFDAFNDAVDEYFYRLNTGTETETDIEAELQEQIERKQRIIDQQESAIDRFGEEAERTRHLAEMLYANYDEIDEILTTVREARETGHSWDEIEETLLSAAAEGIEPAERVRSIDPETGFVTIEIDGETVSLDIREGVEKNADRIYNEAKRVEEKATGAQAALSETKEELAELRAEVTALDRNAPTADVTLEQTETDSTDWLKRSSIPVRKSDEWYERFRWFHTSDDFLVIGGRNADQNEELVRKYLEPLDRFFHAQAHGGPVTILKATGPSERAESVSIPEMSRREAAQFAVSYSSIWKDGKFAGDVYEVSADQVSKTPESGEYLEKGSFAIRGERTYYRDTPVGIAVGVACEPFTRVIGGPPDPIEGVAATAVRIEPGRYAQEDVAKRLYRHFRGEFKDTTFVRKIASPDRIQHFLPPGGSRIIVE